MSDSKELTRKLSQTEFNEITPQVNANAEFFEIAHDFGDALELVREAISNSLDADASEIDIDFNVEQIDGDGVLVIRIVDNGQGMSGEILKRDFWGLGYSTSRDNPGKIGNKGHGTKIYLRSDKIVVRTQTSEAAFESVCENPIKSLYRRAIHTPKFREIPKFREQSGTEITIYGYNKSARAGTKYCQENIVDYIRWFTKFGSVEREFEINKFDAAILRIKGIGRDRPEEIKFGHKFPPESPSIAKLFDKHSTDAAEMYVKRYKWTDQRLASKPEISFDAVIYVEGDLAKRNYNPMIRDRARSDTGRYKVADRYGIYLCRDFVPIERKNDWISGFGWGSNSFVLLHGFVNCQALRLTANRNSIANTDPLLLDELREAVKALIDFIDTDLRKGDFYTLVQWKHETKTKEQEKTEYDRRVRVIKHRKTALLDGHLLVEPQNESELFGLFISLAALRPKLFPFEPLDYVTSRGVDILARVKTSRPVSDSEFAYVELKHKLRTDGFNHSFINLKWIVCWDFDKTAMPGAEFKSAVDEADVRKLDMDKDPKQGTVYFLNQKRGLQKIQVISLKEFMKDKLNLEFKS
jgi:hypothetical protein